MGKFNYSLNNFTAGMLGERLHRRTDLPEYGNGVALMQNMIPLKHGGATKRPGTKFIIEDTSLTNGRIAPFVVDANEGYIVSFGGTIKIWDEEGVSQTVNNSGGFSIPNTAQYVQIGDLLIFSGDGTSEPICVRRDPSSSQFYVETIFNPGSSYRLGIDIVGRDELIMPFLDANVNGEINLKGTATTGSITLYSEGSGGAAVSFFSASHVGAFFKLTIGASTGVCRVTAYVATYQVSAVVIFTLPGTTRTDDWEESAWSDYQGWPSAVTIFEQRLVFGNTTKKPDSLWGSKVGSFFHFMAKRYAQDGSTDVSGLNYFGDITETDPIKFTIASNVVDQIQWLHAGQTLQIGTLGSEYVATGGSERVLSALSVSFIKQSSQGSTKIQPIMVNNQVYFVSITGKKIMSFSYSDLKKSYISENVNFLNDTIDKQVSDREIKQGGFTRMAYQEDIEVVWAIVGTSLVSVTLDGRKEIVGWAKHVLGGRAATVDGFTPDVDDLISLTSSDVSRDVYSARRSIFMITERFINSQTRWYLERLDSIYENDKDRVGFFTSGVNSRNVFDYSYYSDSYIRITPDASTNFVRTAWNTGTDQLTIVAHGYSTGSRVTYDPDAGAPPSPLAIATDYYIRKITVDTIQLHTSREDAKNNTDVIDITDQGSGGAQHEIIYWGNDFWEGLAHLEGEEVSVQGDGYAHNGLLTVASSSITTTEEYYSAIIGLPYKAKLRTLPGFPSSNYDSINGIRRRIDKLTLHFYRTYHCKVGKDADNLEDLEFRDAGHLMDTHPELFTGDKEVFLDTSPDSNGQIYLESDLPLPMELTGITFRGVSYE